MIWMKCSAGSSAGSSADSGEAESMMPSRKRPKIQLASALRRRIPSLGLSLAKFFQLLVTSGSDSDAASGNKRFK